MFRQLSFCVVLFFAGVESVAPKTSPQLSSSIEGPLGAELILSPPEETESDIQESFNALLGSEDIGRKTSLADYASARARMLEAERLAIQGIVEHAMQPLITEEQAH